MHHEIIVVSSNEIIIRQLRNVYKYKKENKF